ncbi:serine proteinase stubble [Rhipicephalus sanguineus]|uniref:serine proteinase stubble n=1 Tax=Rhipicephalus sanguineus TaxID=34632 RepID=UPI0018959A22|nr:serine proteinase stubble [Rhipicephalus sanguineus]XP_049271698.1 serine proteinase stubble [Rhipicephalus sanguineus]
MEIPWTTLIITGGCLWISGALVSANTAKYYTSVTPWKQWTIGRRPCEGVQGETGLCMFNWECIRQEGTMLSACMDGFLLGACCKLPDEANVTTSAWTEASTYTTEDLSKVNSVVTVDASTLPSPSDTHPEASRLPPSTTTTEAPTTVSVSPTTVLSRPRPTTLWPVIRLPSTVKRPVVVRPTQQPQATTLTNHHKPPSITAPAVTTWMTTRPNVLFTPTKLALRPSPFVPTTMYVQRPSLQAVLASTPIGMLSSLITRPFLRPVTMAMKMRPTVATLKPAKKTTVVSTQSDAATTPTQEETSTAGQTTASRPTPTKKYVTFSETPSQTTTAQKYVSPIAASSSTTPSQTYAATTESMFQTASTNEYEPPTAILLHSTTPQKYGYSSTHYSPSQSSFHTVPSTPGQSHAVSRLPPSTLNDLSDLDAEVKTPGYHTTLGMLLPTESGNAHTTHHPEFVDLTETTTTQPPPTNVMEYTLDFDVEDRPTVTEHVYGTTTGQTFGEVTDVTVSNVASAVVSASTEPFSTPRPSTTTKKLKTRSPTMTPQTKARPSTAVSKPSQTKPRPPPSPTTISNDIQHMTYPSKATLWPSTVFKIPLRTTLAARPSTSTLFAGTVTLPMSTTHAHLTLTTPQTTTTLPKRTKKPTTTTTAMREPIPVRTTMAMTAATKPKSTPKPTKPVLPMPARPAKPTKAPLPTKSPTKKTTQKPPSKMPPPSSTFTHSSTMSVATTTEPVANGTDLPTSTSSKQWDYRKHCGVRPLHPQGRIVGGRNSFIGEWPWQVLVKEATWLGLFIKNKCGGVLISDKYALTAAHCQPGFLSSLLVILGAHDLSGDIGRFKPVSIPVRRMIVHRRYNPATFENDLALLELERPVVFQPHIVPICLPGRNEDFTGRTSFVTGWGKLSHGGTVPNVLQYVQVPILSNEKCQKMFQLAGHIKSIRENFVCAGYDGGNRDSCEGDSGGPLTLLRDDGRWVLVGTVSHGIRCAEPNMPGVYMRTSAYRAWIDSVTGQRS